MCVLIFCTIFFSEKFRFLRTERDNVNNLLWYSCKVGTLLVAQLVEAVRYKPEGCGFDSPMVSLEFFIDIILPAAQWPWG